MTKKTLNKEREPLAAPENDDWTVEEVEGGVIMTRPVPDWYLEKLRDRTRERLVGGLFGKKE